MIKETILIRKARIRVRSLLDDTVTIISNKSEVFIYQNNVNQVPKKLVVLSLLATQGKNGLWSVKVEIDQHNHPADTDGVASSLNRIKRLTKNELQDIHDGFENSD